MKENISKLETSSKINLIDEAMNSSAIEGAFSTGRRTEELVQGICLPTTKDENNDVLIMS